MPNVDDVREQIDKGFKGLEESQKKSQESIDSEFELLKKRMVQVESLDQKFEQQEKWISDVESKVNTARTHGPGQDNLVAAIPEEYRRHIDIAQRHGYKDPVNTAAKCLWWHMQFMARMALRQPSGRTAADYIRLADNLEKGWGYDPALKQGVQKANELAETLGSGGSNLVATPVEAELWRLIRDNTVVRPLATKIVMSGPSMVVPTENTNISASLVSEGLAITDSIGTPAFAPQTLLAKKFAGLATVSNELLSDNIIGLNEYLFASIAEAIGILEDRGALDGTGFTGIRVATGVNSLTCALTTTAGGQTATYTDLVKVIFGAIQQASRDGGRFFMYPGVFKNMVSIVDTTGQPVFSFSNVPTAIPSFFGGYPVSMCSMISTSWTFQTTSSNIYFGPPSKILYGDISGMSFDLDPYSLLDKVQTRIRVLKRTGILVPVGGYFTVLNGVQWR